MFYSVICIIHFCLFIGIQGPPGPQGLAGKQHAFLEGHFLIIYIFYAIVFYAFISVYD